MIIEEGASEIEITVEKLKHERELLLSQSSPQERLSQVKEEIINTENLLRELNLKTVSHFDVECNEIVLSSAGGTARHQGGCLGQYCYDPDKGCYVQTNTEKGHELYHPRYLYPVDDGWWVGPTLGVRAGSLRNRTQNQSLPLEGWRYYDGKTFISDTTLVISPGPLTLCDTITVSASGPAAESRPDCLGEFSRTEMWWNGKPVFRNIQGWLMYQSSTQGWIVKPIFGYFGLSGSMAHHCPAREDKWTYFNRSKFQHLSASVKVKCNVHSGKSNE